MLRTLKASREVQKCEVCSELEGEIERFLGDGAGALAGELSTYLAQSIELAEARKALERAVSFLRVPTDSLYFKANLTNAIADGMKALGLKVKAEASDEAV